MKLFFSPTGITVLIYLFAISLYSQTGGDLDFLDKVENIEIPKEESKPSSSNSKTTTSEKKTTKTTKTTKPPEKKTVSPPKPKPVVSKPEPKPQPKPQPVVKQEPPKPAPKPEEPKVSTPKPTVTTRAVPKSKPTPSPVESTPKKEEKRGAVMGSPVWIDEPLDIRPDSLPGFANLSADLGKKESGLRPTDAKTEKKIYPLPETTGDFSIWNSVKGFLSRYQKAFYIFGILILFAIYRLRMGRSSGSSRKQTPTIRRMRR